MFNHIFPVLEERNVSVICQNKRKAPFVPSCLLLTCCERAQQRCRSACPSGPFISRVFSVATDVWRQCVPVWWVVVMTVVMIQLLGHLTLSGFIGWL